MNTAGGLTGGDHVRWSADAAAGRAAGADHPGLRARLSLARRRRAWSRTGSSAEAGAHIDWLPQETILFEGGRLDRRLDVDLAEDATLTAVEAVLLGREAMGEAARNARLRDNWRIRRDGRLIHAEATTLSADPRERDSLSLLAGALAFATVLHVCARRRAPARGRPRAAARDRRRQRHRRAADGAAARRRRGLALRRALSPIIALLSDARAACRASGASRTPR